jgi:hypothetical protein
MVDSCPTCPDTPLNRFKAYPLESNLLTPSGHLSEDDKLNYGSDGFLGKHAVAPRSGQQTETHDQK